MEVNFNGVVNCLQEIIPPMKKQGYGIIAGVSSLAEGRGFPRSGFYSVSKAALSILLESLRVELRPSGIKVTNHKARICPYTYDRKERIRYALPDGC